MKKLTDEEFLENIKKRNYCVMITLPTCSVCHSIIEANKLNDEYDYYEFNNNPDTAKVLEDLDVMETPTLVKIIEGNITTKYLSSPDAFTIEMDN